MASLGGPAELSERGWEAAGNRREGHSSGPGASPGAARASHRLLPRKALLPSALGSPCEMLLRLGIPAQPYHAVFKLPGQLYILCGRGRGPQRSRLTPVPPPRTGSGPHRILQSSLVNEKGEKHGAFGGAAGYTRLVTEPPPQVFIFE